MTEKTIVLPPDNGANGSGAAYRLTLMVPRRRYLSYLRERWWVVVASVALSVLGVVAYETVRPETYVSYARLYVTLAPQLSANLMAEPRDDFASQIELLKDARLRNAAMDHLPPDTVARVKGTINVDVYRPMGASILQLMVTSSDPTVSQQFLQNLIAEFLAFKKQNKLDSMDVQVGRLEDEIKTVETRLYELQTNVTEFEKTNDVAVKEAQASAASFNLSQLRQQLQQQLVDVQMLNMDFSNAADSVTDNSVFEGNGAPAAAPLTNDDAAPLSVFTNAPAMAGAESVSVTNQFLTNQSGSGLGALPLLPSETELRQARLQLALDRQRRQDAIVANGNSDRAPAVKPFTQLVSDDEHRVVELEKRLLQERSDRLEELAKRISITRDYIATNETLLRDGNDLAAKARDLRSNLQRQQSFFDTLSALVRNADLSKSMETERVTTLDEPSAGRPESRNLPLRVFLAIVGGLAVSMASVFGWHLLDDRFVSVRDVKDQFGESVLGLVPQIKVPRRQAAKALLATQDSRPQYAESYRHLRSALLFSARQEHRPQTLLLTGATPGEGKTTVAVNLATTLARSGLRVALVDVDLHHPVGIDTLLGRPAQPGVLDFLRGEVAFDDVLQETDEPNLALVSSGTHKNHAEGLFLRPQLAELLARLRQDRDFVILDGAPILGSDNPALLVPHADAVVLVARPFFTRAQQMRRALEMLYQRQAKVITIVFNRARPDDLQGHYAANGLNKVAKNGKA